MSTQPLNIISRYGEDDISLWMVNVEFEDYKRVAGNAVQLKVELSRYLHRGSPPHTRGKGSSMTGILSPKLGSPPHTRGKGNYVKSAGRLARITPAHAGKSFTGKNPDAWGRDHPRTRGEKRSPLWGQVPRSGSPPHTRGKVGMPELAQDLPGITPAHAGKRPVFSEIYSVWRDHPRTRGEKKLVRSALYKRPGSPPHTRGKEVWIAIAAIITRITPAHAGKSTWLC